MESAGARAGRQNSSGWWWELARCQRSNDTPEDRTTRGAMKLTNLYFSLLWKAVGFCFHIVSPELPQICLSVGVCDRSHGWWTELTLHLHFTRCSYPEQLTGANRVKCVAQGHRQICHVVGKGIQTNNLSVAGPMLITARLLGTSFLLIIFSAFVPDGTQRRRCHWDVIKAT